MPDGGMPFVNNKERMIDKLRKFFSSDELLVSFGKSSSYEYISRAALQPAFKKVPRNMLKRHTQQAYFQYKDYLMEIEPFVCVTVHWFLQKRIICFDAMEEAYNEYNIKIRIINYCKHFHLLDNFFSLSLDNATANTRAIDFLKEDPSLSLLLNELGSPTRWNYTYKLSNYAIRYHDIWMELYKKSSSDMSSLITSEHWAYAMVIRDVLVTFGNATSIYFLFCL
ncbi:putative AC transposase [Bienertia sinuspersici]